MSKYVGLRWVPEFYATKKVMQRYYWKRFEKPENLHLCWKYQYEVNQIERRIFLSLKKKKERGNLWSKEK